MSSSESRCPSRLVVITVTASVTVSPASLCLLCLPFAAFGQVGGGEGGGEQDLQLHRAVRGIDQQVTAARFEQELPAAAAGQQRIPVARDHGHRDEVAVRL